MAQPCKDKNLAKTKSQTSKKSKDTCATVNPGICGFTCHVKARKIEKKIVALEIAESECNQIQQFSGHLSKITLRELFVPVTKNPVYLSAEKSGCHPSCPIPVAVLKAAEVAMEMALPRDVMIQFEDCQEDNYK
jgi:hypothetical protein